FPESFILNPILTPAEQSQRVIEWRPEYRRVPSASPRILRPGALSEDLGFSVGDVRYLIGNERLPFEGSGQFTGMTAPLGTSDSRSHDVGVSQVEAQNDAFAHYQNIQNPETDHHEHLSNIQ